MNEVVQSALGPDRVFSLSRRDPLERVDSHGGDDRRYANEALPGSGSELPLEGSCGGSQGVKEDETMGPRDPPGQGHE
jgi:hypothetical protein